MYSQVPEPVKSQEQPIVLINGMIHVGDGSIIENGTVAFENGKITYVGNTFTNTKFNRILVDGVMHGSGPVNKIYFTFIKHT